MASKVAGARMPNGGSCASLFGTCLPTGPSKKTPCTKRTDVAKIAEQMSTGPDRLLSSSVKNISLDKKPLVKGTPAIDAAVTIVKVAV
ncbi:hypothetical protein LTR94_022159 [Friedmanniomyces endolithicus]|nr:hypothetical protein LTR94_022159 [Friedmanniomyces endolithicus]